MIDTELSSVPAIAGVAPEGPDDPTGAQGVGAKGHHGASDDDLDDERHLVYGTFIIGDKLFTLSAREIREVVAYPERVTSVPGAPAYVAGVFGLRGEVIPVIDAAALLGIADAPAHRPGESRIAILDCGAQSVGLIFESTAEVLEVQPEQLHHFDAREGEVRRLVTGILKLGDDDQLVQVLSAEALAGLPGVPWGVQPRAAERDDDDADVASTVIQLVVVSVAGTTVAIDVRQVLEIHAELELCQTTTSVGILKGLVELRGSRVFVMDLAVILCGKASAPGASQRMVFAHDGERVCALMVDQVLDVLNVEPRELVSVVSLSRFPSGRFFNKVALLPGGHEALLLDINDLYKQTSFTLSQRVISGKDLITDFDDDDDDEDEDETQSFLTFGLGERAFCMNLTSIQEIQNFPERLLTTPGDGETLVGIMSLRGEVVPVIDLRALYKLESQRPATECKVVILPSGGQLQGVLVDELTGIHHVADAGQVLDPDRLGPMMRDSRGPAPFAPHVCGGVHVDGAHGSGLMMILDPQRF